MSLLSIRARLECDGCGLQIEIEMNAAATHIGTCLIDHVDEQLRWGMIAVPMDDGDTLCLDCYLDKDDD